VRSAGYDVRAMEGLGDKVMKLQRWWTELHNDVRGATTAEMAVLFVVIVVGSLALWVRLGKAVAGIISD
jgi:hypothetical protein